MADDIQIILSVESKEVSRAVDEIIRLGKASKDTAKAFEQGFKKVVSWQEKFSTEQGRVSAALEKSYLAQQKSNKAARDSAKVFMEDAAAKEANTAQVHRYRMASDSVYAAEQKLLQLKKVLRTEIANDNMTIREAAAVQMQYKQSLNQVGTSLQQSRQRMSSMGVVTQQAGYQMGDFIVQVQSGQNALIAFSQQATQMVGFLPLMASKLGLTAGAAIGLSAVLGIAIPIISSLAMVLLTVKNSSDKSSESTKDFGDRLKAAREEVRGMSDDLSLLKSGFDNMFEKTLSDQVTKAQEELARATKNLMDLEEQGRGGHQKRISKQKLEDAQKAVQVAQEELDSARDIVAETKVINNLKEQSVAFTEAQSEATEKARAKAEDYLSLVSKLEEELGEAEVTALMLAGVDLETGINAGVSAAARLAVQLGVALGVAQQIQLAQVSLSNKNQVYSGRGSIGMPGETDRSGEFKPSEDIVKQADILLGLKDQPKTKGSKGRSGGGGKSPAEELSEYLQKKQEEAILQEKLLGLFGEERDIQSELISAKEKYNGVMTTAQANELEGTLRQIEADKERQRVLEEAKQQQEQLASMIANQMGDAFMSIVDGTKSVKDAFKDMARAIIKELYQIFVVKKITGFLESAVGNILPSADGNVFSGGSQVKAYANGGVVGGPTYFPMSGGKTGLMGEAGPEAIMPLKRGSNGKLGVQMEGSSGGDVVINQSFNFQANGDDSVKKLIAQAAPQIANMTQKQIMDSRRRGGAMKSTFG